MTLGERGDLLGSDADPLATRAFAMMTGGPITPRQLADAAGKPLAEIARYLDELRQAGLVQLMETREVDGRQEPFYDGPYAPFLDPQEWEEVDADLQRLYISRIVSQLVKDLNRGMTAETIQSRPDFHLCRVPFRLDEQGWTEMRTLFDETLVDAVRISQEAAKRLQEDGQEPIRGSAALTLFELPE
jgi:DNA-binding transcriptional ArsR family regulator